MSTLRDDDSGQFILLMSVVVAIGLVIVLVFLNQSMMAGHSSSESIINFPKNDIRDFRAVTVNEAYVLGTSMDPATFNSTFDRYIGQTKDIFDEEGTMVDVSYKSAVNTSTNRLDNTTIDLYYNNGETEYNDTTIVYMN